jgi:hypothetical protein
VRAGFSAQELEDLVALAPVYQWDDNHLWTSANDQIHPVFQKDKWKEPLPSHMALFPAGGRPDKYERADRRFDVPSEESQRMVLDHLWRATEHDDDFGNGPGGGQRDFDVERKLRAHKVSR